MVVVVSARGNIVDFVQVVSGNALEEDCRNWGWDIASEKEEEDRGSSLHFDWEKKEER